MTRACPTCGIAYPDETFFCGADGAITVQEQSESDFDPRLGKQLGGHVLVARVADGAMGRVYEGRHIETRARVAVKVLHDHVVRDRVAVERFKREYETANELDSPYIVDVLKLGETPDGSYFLTMEYLHGRELAKALAERKPLPLPVVIQATCQVALALEHAHSFGFIHRDLKPDNIFLCETPAGVQVRILDFGSVKLQMETGVKLTALGTTLGSPYYMSPEQATGASDVDQRSDVFALGAILYEMLTGHTAFEAPSVALILMKILNQSPPRAGGINAAVTPAIEAVIDHALRKDKASRYATARELADGLLQACGLSGTVESWAQRPQAEIAAALRSAAPPVESSASAQQPRAAAQPRAVASPPRAVAQSSAAAVAPVGAVSDAPLSVPKADRNAKLAVSIAIGVALLCVIALLMR